MYENVGGKLKVLAKVQAWLGIILSVIVGLVVMLQRSGFLLGVLYMALGALGSWLSSLAVYGIGDTLDTVKIIERRVLDIEETVELLESKHR